MISGLSLALVGAACAEVEEPTPVPPDETAFQVDITPGPVALRKLTRAQYKNAIADVLGPELSIPPIAEPDAVLGGLASVGAAGTSYSPRGIESFEEVAYAVASQAMDNEAVRARLVPCSPSAAVDPGCAEAALDALAHHAWRRPATAEELATLVAMAGEAAGTLKDFHDGLEFGVAAILQSPHFLYRAELGGQVGETNGADETNARVFSGHELATRLSFFLWNTTPDAALLAAAEAGELITEAGLRAQAERLLADPRARKGMRRFFVEWLRLEELESLSKDPTLFDFYTSDLGPSALEETLALLDWMVFEEQRDIRTLMTTTTTFVNPLLAALYGIPAPGSEDELVRVQLPVDGPRAGLLGHASFLNAHAHAVSTSVTLRGKAVRNILLCQPTPDPPVDVDTSIPEPSGTAPTMRERVAEHLEDPGCAGCHLLMDPIGLGLERFDGTGRYRNLDNGAQIDPSGDLDGEEYLTARELGVLVGSHPDFTRCLVRTLARYASGRAETLPERAHIDTLEARFRLAGYQLKPLILDVVLSPLFGGAGEPSAGEPSAGEPSAGEPGEEGGAE